MENPIPSQEQGSEMDAVEKATFDTPAEASAFYQVAKDRLLNVNRWAEVSALPSSTFRLCDDSGAEVDRLVKDGDYFKIDIPGPGTSSGDGYDWVKVEHLQEEAINGTNVLSIRVRPAANPNSPDQDTAHFFKDSATSTFQVKRINREVFAEVHGRNEQPNTDTGHVTDTIRNTLVGTSAKVGFSFPQWKGLVAGLVKPD
jgi:hypothetical protein